VITAMGTLIRQENGAKVLQQDSKNGAWADENDEMRKLANEALKSMNSYSVSKS
jgi:hypothetical protein